MAVKFLMGTHCITDERERIRNTALICQCSSAADRYFCRGSVIKLMMVLQEKVEE